MIFWLALILLLIAGGYYLVMGACCAIGIRLNYDDTTPREMLAALLLWPVVFACPWWFVFLVGAVISMLTTTVLLEGFR